MDDLNKARKKLTDLKTLIGNSKFIEAQNEFEKVIKFINDNDLRRSAYSLNSAIGYIDKDPNKGNDEKEMIESGYKLIEEIERHFNFREKEQRILSKSLSTKLDQLINKYLKDLPIKKGDLETKLNAAGVTLKQFETGLIRIRDHFDFFKKEFRTTKKMSVSNCVLYVIEALYIDEKKSKGPARRKEMIEELKGMLK